MKHIITLFLIPFMLSANAQTEKSWVIGINLGCKYQNKGDLTFDVNNPRIHQTYGTSFSNEIKAEFHLGRQLNDNIAIGFGINTFIAKKEVIDYRNIEYKGKGISPIIYIDYLKNLIGKLSMVIKGYIQYDFCNYKVVNSSNAYGYGQYIFSPEEKYNYQYINLGLRPSFRFELNKKIGLELTLGKIEYKKKTQDFYYETKNDNASSFQINLKPENWLVGVFFNI